MKKIKRTKSFLVNKQRKQKQVAIVIADFIFLWYGSTFFTVASTFMNIAGVGILISLILLTIKFFKK